MPAKSTESAGNTIGTYFTLNASDKTIDPININLMETITYDFFKYK